MKDNLLTLTTEERNPNSMNLSKMSIFDSVTMMNKEDFECAKAVQRIIPIINDVIEQCIKIIRNGGRVVFIGAAHSGYLGTLDVYEANATFGTTGEFVSIVAGNFTDMMKTDGSAEDQGENAKIDLINNEVNQKDFVIGLSSSGRTPYVVAALKWCRENDIKCACLTNNYNTLVSRYCDYSMEAVAGPEVITGSTRLKAGTCQKMILNMITTISMAQLGNVYENLMINVPPVSKKMCQRLEYILTQATGCTLERAHVLLKQTNYSVKQALLMELKNVSLDEAREELEVHKGNINYIL